MAGFSDAAEIDILDHIFKGSAMAQPTNLYIALCKSTIADDDTGSTLPTECTGGAYVRHKCNTWDAAAAGSVVNSQVEQFVEATDNWGTMTDFAICTTTTTGLLIGYAKLSTPKKIGTGDTAKFATGDLKCKLD